MTDLLDPGELMSPAAADNFRMTVDYGRFYIDPLPADDIADATEQQWPSYSQVKKAAEKDWSFLTVNRIAHLEPAELERIARLDHSQRGDAIRSHEKVAKNTAFGRGTIVHLWAEDLAAGHSARQITDGWLHVNGYPAAARDEAEQYRAAITDFFQTHQPEPVAVEYVTIHRTLHGYGYGATPDGLFTIGGQLAALDWKTRGAGTQHAAYAEEAAQIAAGARAEYMIALGGETAVRQLLPKVDVGYVVSIKPDGARLYPVDIDAAWTHFQHLHQWWVHRQTEKASIGRILPAKRGTKKISPADADDRETSGSAPVVARNTTDGCPTSAGEPSRHKALLARFEALTHDQKNEFKGRRIPKGNLDAVEKALDDIEHPATVRQIVAKLKTKPPNYEAGDDVRYKGQTWKVGVDNGSSVYLPDLPDHLSFTDPHPKAGQWGHPEKHVRWVPKSMLDVAEPKTPQTAINPKPDEGPDVADTDWEPLGAAYAALPQSAKDWCARLLGEARNAGHPFNKTNAPTLRRYELYRGIIRLAATGDNPDTILIGLICAAADDDRDGDTLADATPGHALGLLDHIEAKAFSQLVDQLADGGTPP